MLFPPQYIHFLIPNICVSVTLYGKKKLQMELSSESLDREIILDYQGRLTIITRVLVRGRQEAQS